MYKFRTKRFKNRTMLDKNSSIDWNDLRVFLAVLRAGSLRGAARRLELNHATVNRRLTALEAGFGSKLFDRTRAGFVPTQAGEELLAAAELVEDELFRVEQTIAGRDANLSGEVKVSLPYAIIRGLLADDLCRFSRQYPDIHLEIDLTDDFTDLARLEADVSIRMAYEVTDDVVGRRLVQYAKTIYAAPQVAQRLDPRTGTLQGDEIWIGWHGAEGNNAWTRGTPYSSVLARHDMPHHAAQIELARGGMGLTMLPCFLGDREPGLRRVPGAEVVPDRSIWLLLRPGLRRTARVRAFVDFIADAIMAQRRLIDGGAT